MGIRSALRVTLNRPASRAVLIVFTLCVAVISVFNYYDGFLRLHLHEPVRLLLDAYQETLRSVAKIAEPHVIWIVGHLRDLLGIDLSLHPHWAALFVPAWLYFSTDAGAVWGLPERGRKVVASIMIFLGGVIAFALSVGTGLSELNSPLILTASILAFAIFDFCAAALTGMFVIYEQHRTGMAAFWFQIKRRLFVTLPLGLMLIAVGWQVQSWGFSHINALLVMVFVFLLGVRDLANAAWIASRGGGNGDTYWARLTSMARWRIGLRVIAAIGIPSVIAFL